MAFFNRGLAHLVVTNNNDLVVTNNNEDKEQRVSTVPGTAPISLSRSADTRKII
jgi:hypothetical protein